MSSSSYAALALTSARVASTRGRRDKVALLAETLQHCAAGDVAIAVAHLSGSLPQRRTGVGWRGLSAMPSPAAEPQLTIAEVDEALTALTSINGVGSAQQRRDVLAQLMSRATESEQNFLRDLLRGNLRQGALDGVMLPAIAAAFDVPEAAVRRATMLAGFAGPVAEIAATQGDSGLAAVTLVPGRPVRPMLAASATSVAEAAGSVSPVIVDGKLDGIRVQAHRVAGQVSLYTRSLDDITDRLPDVVAQIEALPGGDLVLDGEAIVIREDGRPAPFQVTGARTASGAVEDLVASTPLHTFIFDVLYAERRLLIDEPLQVRDAVLRELAPDLVVPRRLVEDASEGQAFFDELVAAGHEGVVVKDPEAPYAAGRRGSGWVKVKPVHTFDLVVLAVEQGNGRRVGTLSNIHLGARDPRTGDFVMVGKTFKGMTDAMLVWQTERFTELATDGTDGYVVPVRPEQVVEIAIDGLQRSSRYPAGVALRFARVVRYRDDKAASQADTIDDLLRLFPQ